MTYPLLVRTGWGGPPRQADAGAARARGRGGRGRRGRGRGARRGGRAGRRASRGYDDDGSDSESDLPQSVAGDAPPSLAPDLAGGAAAPPAKLTVEQIYGWRWPKIEEAQPPVAEAKCVAHPLNSLPLHASSGKPH